MEATVSITSQNADLVKNLNPQKLLAHFLTLCATPRGSENEGAIADIIHGLAVEHDFEAICDSLSNILVRVPATPGLEGVPSICLQSHLDMVLAKNPEVENIYPIQLIFENGLLRANGTTLGADNGIGVAAMMTLITEADIPHGPLELLFTTIEETGLVGAEGFDYSQLVSKKIMNLDSEEEGIFFVGCAGGARTEGIFNPMLTDPYANSYSKYLIELFGFTGGHSGIEIHMNRANPIKILADMLSRLDGIDVYLMDFSGGTAMNAIPQSAQATALVPTLFAEHLPKLISDFFARVRDTYPNEAPGLRTTLQVVTGEEKVWEDETQRTFLKLMETLPQGVLSMEPKDASMVRTSNNIGMVRMTNDGRVKITSMYRSSLESEIDDMMKKVEGAFLFAAAEVKTMNRYSPWEPQFDTELLMHATNTYGQMFQTVPKLMTIHAGLECAAFYKRIPNVEIISFGPTMGDVHTPKEWVDVASVERFWSFLCALIK